MLAQVKATNRNLFYFSCPSFKTVSPPSLNGYRATVAMEQVVPNVKRFRLLLRLVKAWAKRRGLYGNMVGFLGGASWAILVAKVCQLEVDSSGPIAHLVFLFFEVSLLYFGH